MKINTEQLEALQNQNNVKRKIQEEAGNFSALLSQELGRGSETGGVASSMAAPGIDMLGGILALEQAQAVESVKDPEQELMNDLENLLGKWENYSDYLKGANGDKDLRNAFGLLESITGDLDQIKGNNPDISQLQPQLQNIVNELDAMTVAERFKFNRGDYF